MDTVKLLFPADRTSFQYGVPGDPIRTPQITGFLVYLDEEATMLADIYATTGGRILNSTIYTDDAGLLPEFLGPLGVKRLWAVAQVDGHSVAPYPLDAAFGPRIDLLNDTISAPGSVNTIYSGEGAPSNILGSAGDWYIDKVAVVLYGPKTDVWPTGVSLVGPQGPAGSGGSGQAYPHSQFVSASIWDIVHPLPFIPNVMVVDSGGSRVEGDVHVLTPSHIQVEFSVPFAGTAMLS